MTTTTSAEPNATTTIRDEPNTATTISAEPDTATTIMCPEGLRGVILEALRALKMRNAINVLNSHVELPENLPATDRALLL